MTLFKNAERPVLPQTGPSKEQHRGLDIIIDPVSHQLDILAWLRGTTDLVDAIRDGAMLRPESVIALIAAEHSSDRAKALAMGLAAQKLAMPADIDAAFRAWPELAGA